MQTLRDKLCVVFLENDWDQQLFNMRSLESMPLALLELPKLPLSRKPFTNRKTETYLRTFVPSYLQVDSVEKPHFIFFTDHSQHKRPRLCFTST